MGFDLVAKLWIGTSVFSSFVFVCLSNLFAVLWDVKWRLGLPPGVT